MLCRLHPGSLAEQITLAHCLVAGIGCGRIFSVVPIYLAEVSKPDHRGFLAGLQGMMIAIGCGVANWIGYAGAFAKGDGQWRIPLAMQLPIPVILLRHFLPKLNFQSVFYQTVGFTGRTSLLISGVYAQNWVPQTNNDNQGSIASIFLYSMSYAVFFNAMIWLVPSELFPFFLRTKGMALAVAIKAIVAIVLS
ncbi:high-affinity glucose transporter [Fusarium tjaetaba]|uniref:High-affinity glucose transporter n=1 Tax=Fusarium tjaetaba TaxID=1567544 RepID=A0A8H5VJ70_9HYPO|nr:high-affinity glucose transporter [Fusarium tjaetaba]KAF5626792.1 high-affinity glucose transporter [Fusarium tjaetaba]